MTIALLSDVHGNCVALDAVLADLDRLGVTDAVCLGDAAQGGPQPAEVLDRLAARGWPVVLGNADAFLLDPAADPAEEASPEQLEVREWTLSRLAPAHVEQIGAFLPTVERRLPDGARLLAFHGSPRSNLAVILPETEPGPFLDGLDADVLAGGQVHTQWSRRVGAALFVNPGSVGLPYDRHLPEADFRLTAVAEYALLHAAAAVELRRIPFDAKAVVAAARAGSRPYADAHARQWGI